MDEAGPTGPNETGLSGRGQARWLQASSELWAWWLAVALTVLDNSGRAGLGGAVKREDGVSLGVLEHQPSRGRSGKVGFTLVHVYVCVHVCVSACAYVNAHCHTVKGEQVREQFLRSAQSEP